ncbi:MAG: AMP-binding protein, partial [Euzebyaceae bacterium]|nr:AMP-binding protein [Euzebyaceae bacterium]
RWVLTLPSSYIAGVQVIVRSLVAGHQPAVVDGFDLTSALGGHDEAPHFLSLVPTQLHRLVGDPAQAPAIARCHTVLLGGGRIDPGLRRRAEGLGIHVVATYGASETAGGCVYDGVPLDGVEVLIGADARVRVRGPVLARGYRLRPDLTAGAFAGGTFTTGDLGRWTPDGRLDVIGRADDVIVTGGENVAAGEVAELLARHPAVAEAAVVGRPDPEWGQRVVAVVVPADPAAPPDLAQLRAFVTAAAAAHHAPRQLVVVDRLPLLPTGKVDREALREL